jgi:hypothetical protein
MLGTVNNDRSSLSPHTLHQHTRRRLRLPTLLSSSRNSRLDNILPDFRTQLPRHSTTLAIPITPHLGRNPQRLLRKYHSLYILSAQIPLQAQHDNRNTFIVVEMGFYDVFPGTFEGSQGVAGGDGEAEEDEVGAEEGVGCG